MIEWGAEPHEDALVLTFEWRQNRFATSRSCPVFGVGFSPVLGPELFLVQPDNRLGDCVDLESLTHYFLEADEVNRPAGPYPDDGASQEGPRTRVRVELNRPSVVLGLLNVFLLANRRPEAFASACEPLARAVVRHADVLFEHHGHQWDLVGNTLARWYRRADRSDDPFWSQPEGLRAGFPALAAEIEESLLARRLPSASCKVARPRM